MAINLPPPPIKENLPPTIKEWLNKLYQFVGGVSGQIGWGQINTDGAELDDIPTRPHSQLQALTADDHPQYLLTNGQRQLSADWDAGNQKITSKDLAANDFVIFDKASGSGMKVDLTSPTFGWKDLLGDVVPKTTGVGSPQLDTFRNDVRWFDYAVGEDGDMVFHIPHDYVPGTDLYIHVHWGHNGTNISGSFDVRFHATYAKGHQQANFPADVEPHLVVSSLNITNTPQYHHRIDEFQLSTAGGSATQIDTSVIEPDGLIIIHYDVDVIPTITGGSGKPFIFAIDLHYQSTGLATKNKSPNFYS